MEKEQVEKEIEEIVKRHGAYPALVISTKEGGDVLGELRALYSDRLSLRKFNTPVEHEEEYTLVIYSVIKRIKYMSQIELIRAYLKNIHLMV